MGLACARRRLKISDCRFQMPLQISDEISDFTEVADSSACSSATHWELGFPRRRSNGPSQPQPKRRPTTEVTETTGKMLLFFSVNSAVFVVHPFFAAQPGPANWCYGSVVNSTGHFTC
jgi:hypothetical protein